MSGNLHPLATTKLAGWRITDLIESRQGAGYRIAWPFKS